MMRFCNTNNLRSPLDGVNIRRQAGQSASEKADELSEDWAVRVVLPVASVLVAALFELIRWLGGRFSWTVFVLSLVLAIGYSLFAFLRGRNDIRHWLRGAQGERYVGQILDREMPPRGYKVYHDIQIEKGRRKMNIDHLLVGANGVYLIEDKTWSKPIKGRTVVRFDGQRVYRNDIPDDRPVREAFALAKEANAYIKSLTGVSVPVKPVLVFVGWYNQAENRHDSPLLVLSEKGLPNFLKNHRPQQVPSERDLRLVTEKLDAANG